MATRTRKSAGRTERKVTRTRNESDRITDLPCMARVGECAQGDGGGAQGLRLRGEWKKKMQRPRLNRGDMNREGPFIRFLGRKSRRRIEQPNKKSPISSQH